MITVCKLSKTLLKHITMTAFVRNRICYKICTPSTNVMDVPSEQKLGKYVKISQGQSKSTRKIIEIVKF